MGSVTADAGGSREVLRGERPPMCTAIEPLQLIRGDVVRCHQRLVGMAPPAGRRNVRRVDVASHIIWSADEVRVVTIDATPREGVMALQQQPTMTAGPELRHLTAGKAEWPHPVWIGMTGCAELDGLDLRGLPVAPSRVGGGQRVGAGIAAVAIVTAR